jgi:hypothetical protein
MLQKQYISCTCNNHSQKEVGETSRTHSIQEVLGRTYSLLSFDTTRTALKTKNLRRIHTHRQPGELISPPKNEGTHRSRQQSDVISLVLFFQNKENRLKTADMVLIRKAKNRISLGRPRHRRENNIKTDIKHIVCEM